MLVKKELDKDLVHVYFMPGMAAKPKIFEHIKLPKDKFKIHWLSWKVPKENESLKAYVSRMLQEIKHQNPVLVGVSFGGIIVQEMSKHIAVKRLLIISSVKSHHELPQRMKIAKKSKLYKIFPTSLAKHVGKVSKLPVSNFIKKRVALYKEYMWFSNAYYLDWAIEKMLLWEQDEPRKDIIHIHGDADLVFPIKNIKNCIIIKGGTHVMIINRYRWFNENLPNLIREGKL